ncbi:phage baseplate assembly protein V [Flavobacterium sp.]|uniref:phage baseplate assembly protein V n=1 Tax=Flavobacterium sp. TaxID=239 RepID=UPI003A95232C
MPDLQPYYPSSDTLLNLEFLINGVNTGLDVLLKEATIQFELNRIPLAKFTFVDAANHVEEEEELPINSLTRNAGDPPIAIEVKVNFEGSSETIFKGIIKSLDKRIEGDQITAKVECKDIALQLTQSSSEEENNNQTFGDKLTLFTRDLTVSDNLTNQPWSEEQITHNTSTTPWDYLIGFLDSIGMMVALRNTEFTGIDILDTNHEPSYKAENGINVFTFNGRIDPERRRSSVTIERWDIETQSVSRVSSEQNADDNPHTVRVSQTSLQESTLEKIANATLERSNIAAIQGRVTTFGNLSAKLGDYITFSKVNNDIDDIPLLISQEVHSFENGCWKTEYTFGLENERSFTESTSPGVNNTQAQIGQSNTLNGLQIGVVTQIEEDPNNQFRIKVRIPILSENGEGIWARLATLNASNETGSFFIPDVDDEVVVGCIGNNPDTPVVLGCLYSSNKPMPFPIDANNYKKGFVTKEGTRIVIDGETKSIEISTNDGNKVLISDDQKGITLEDANSNKVILNDQGITIESCKDLNIKANGNIKVEGIQTGIEASSQLELKGSIINLN